MHVQHREIWTRRHSPRGLDRSEYYGCGRLAEVHGLGEDAHSGAFAVTTEGRVLLGRILEVRRRPLNVLVFPSALGAAEPAGSCSERSGRGEGEDQGG